MSTPRPSGLIRTVTEGPTGGPVRMECAVCAQSWPAASTPGAMERQAHEHWTSCPGPAPDETDRALAEAAWTLGPAVELLVAKGHTREAAQAWARQTAVDLLEHIVAGPTP